MRKIAHVLMSNRRVLLYAGNLALVVVLGYLVLRSILLPDALTQAFTPSPTHAAGDSADPVVPNAPITEQEYERIIARDIFAASGDTADAVTDPPDKSLNTAAPLISHLRLLGTVDGSPQVARAIINDRSAGTTDIYKISDAVAGARIERIERNRVTLFYEGRTYVLRPKAEEPSGGSAAKPADNAPPAKQRLERNPFAKADTPAAAEPPGISGAIDTILKKAVIRPYTVNGRTEGLRISNVEDLPAARLIGLKDNDIICVINGQQLTSKQKAFQVFKKLKTQSNIDVELLRDNQVKRLSFRR